MFDHLKSTKCQTLALEQGLIPEIKEWSKDSDKDAKKEYDRMLYEKRKEEGYYDDKKRGPRTYHACTWILKRAAKDGRKAGDQCGSNCAPKPGQQVFCTMHQRVFAKSL